MSRITIDRDEVSSLIHILSLSLPSVLLTVSLALLPFYFVTAGCCLVRKICLTQSFSVVSRRAELELLVRVVC